MLSAARYFSRKRGLAAFMAAGPLSAVLDELAGALEATGHSVTTIQGYVRSARHARMRWNTGSSRAVR